ncbi:hypothetical protein HYQ45_000413 [Verticillium longisporum]|uniref:Pyridoxamine 5'-phosphate oxidase Alr4036 family FMN-binding domain-containing protein n=1 Tax=Verticillium longisporum TaxID=100787 RepID=A0A8I3AXU2_VERLO|nr:hypothetical protein HYQ45_000413 [Verticillium longisporum]
MQPVASSLTAAAPAQRIAHLARTMSSSSSAAGAGTATSSAPAPWRSLFLEHINTMPAPEFTLATLHDSSSGAGGPGPGLVPRARTCIHRGLFASLPVNPKNEAPLNPPAYESDLLTLTTDARMHKTPDLAAGHPVEAVFWAREPATQWRVRGVAYVLPRDADADAALTARLLREMRRTGEGEGEGDARGWSFSREVTAHFGNLSPGEGLGQVVTDLEDEVARANFRVVVVVPDEVDRVDLSDPKRGRRWLYRRAIREGDWEKNREEGGSSHTDAYSINAMLR